MSRKKIFRKKLEVCNECPWFERRYNFKYRCGMLTDGYSCHHKYINLEDFLKKEPDNKCLHALQHKFLIITE